MFKTYPKYLKKHTNGLLKHHFALGPERLMLYAKGGGNNDGSLVGLVPDNYKTLVDYFGFEL